VKVFVNYSRLVWVVMIDFQQAALSTQPSLADHARDQGPGAMTSEHRHGRGTRIAWLGLLLFKAMIVGVEAMLVLAAGQAVTAGLHAAGFSIMPPAPVALAGAYLLLVVATGAAAQPPRRRRESAALRVLLTVFVVGLLVDGRLLHALPALAVWFALAGCGIVFWRRLAMRLALAMPAIMPPRRPMAFIGNSDAAARLLLQIQANPHARLQPIGFFDDRNARVGPLHDKLPHLGTIDELVGYIHDHELRDVFVALPWSAGERIAALTDRLRFLPLTVRLIPDHAPPALRQRNAHQLEGVVMPTLMLPPSSPVGAAAKRGLDLLGCVLLLVPVGLLFLMVAAAIRIDSPGPVFFRQSRFGQYGRSFSIFKFRTLHVASADVRAETSVHRGDIRVTRIGRYLRRYSIDELPQIINVLLGEMSLVGPRPHAPRSKADGRIFAEVMSDYMLRYRVKPGMTGLAQVNGWRGNTDTEEKLRKRVEFDFDYIRNSSIFRDLKIIAWTIPSVLAPPVDNV
jgi:exopolysaccharide biosynthesis polyprenyl glycosylphosphotransferase